MIDHVFGLAEHVFVFGEQCSGTALIISPLAAAAKAGNLATKNSAPLLPPTPPLGRAGPAFNPHCMSNRPAWLARCWNPDRPDEDFELVISCLCTGDHQPLEFEIDRRGNPVGPVTGNMLCW